MNHTAVAGLLTSMLILAMIITSQAFGSMIDSSREQVLVDIVAEDVMCNTGKTETIRLDSAICNAQAAITSGETSSKYDGRENILTVSVVDIETKSPISDATVIVADTSGKIVVWKITDKNGTQQLDLSSGDYYIVIKANCCYTKMDNLRIEGDMEKIFELVDR